MQSIISNVRDYIEYLEGDSNKNFALLNEEFE